MLAPCVCWLSHSCSRVMVAFSLSPVGLTSVNVAISGSPEVNTPFSRVTFETYIPLPKPLDDADVVSGAGTEPLSTATTFPIMFPGLVVELDP